MKQLYLKIIELLSQIPEIRYSDLNTGQLQEEKPPLAYPAALIDVELPRIETIDSATELVEGNVQVCLVFKAIGETNSIASEAERLNATTFMDLTEKVQHHIHGYADKHYYPFQCVAVRLEPTRKGLKVVRLTFGTSWHDYTAS